MTENVPHETERKFLIRMPDREMLLSLPGAFCDEIVQTYLLAPAGETARVRRRKKQDGKVIFTETRKRRLSVLTCEERERQITEEEYRALLSGADPCRRPVEKCRFVIPYEGQTLEIDIYPFWQRTAVLEIELPSEGAACRIPGWLSVIREVSADPAYKNHALAISVPPEEG